MKKLKIHRHWSAFNNTYSTRSLQRITIDGNFTRVWQRTQVTRCGLEYGQYGRVTKNPFRVTCKNCKRP